VLEMVLIFPGPPRL